MSHGDWVYAAGIESDIERFSKATLERQVLIGDVFVDVLATNGSEVAFYNQVDQTIQTAPIPGGPITTVLVSDVFITALHIDEHHVYWATTPEPNANVGGEVWQANIDGSESTLVAGDQNGPVDIVSDDAAIYWLNASPGSVVMRVKDLP